MKLSRHNANVAKSHQVKSKIISIRNNGAKLNYLRKINEYVFEELVLTSLDESGYRIKRNERYSGDHGLDGKLLTRGGMIFIQSKRYSGYINPKDVSDFGEVCKRHNAYGLFIHTGKTGKKSRGSKSRHVDIISGDRLLNLISASKISLRLPFSYRLKSIWNFLFTTPVNY